MALRTKLTRKRKRTFLEHLRETCNVTESAQLAGVSRTAMYERRAIDPELAKAWDDAVEQATDALEKKHADVHLMALINPSISRVSVSVLPRSTQTRC